MYIFLTILSALFLGIYEVFKKVSLKKSSVYETLFFYCLVGTICSVIFSRGQVFDISIANVSLILLKSSIIVVNWFLILVCMKKLDVGIVVPFGLVNTVLTVFGSALIFKEKITRVHFISLFFISIGIILLSFIVEKDERKKSNYKYLFILFLANILGTMSALLDKYLINYRQVEWQKVLFYFFLFNTIIYGIIYLVKNKKIEISKLVKNYGLIVTGVTIALADGFYYYAIGYPDSEMSMISIIRKFSVVISTVLAGFLLKEKKIFKKLGICFIMLIGVILPFFIH